MHHRIDPYTGCILKRTVLPQPERIINFLPQLLGVYHMIDIATYSDIYKEQAANLILFIQQSEFDIPITREQQPDLNDISTFYQSGNGNFWLALADKQVVGTIALLDIGNKQGAL